MYHDTGHDTGVTILYISRYTIYLNINMVKILLQVQVFLQQVSMLDSLKLFDKVN